MQIARLKLPVNMLHQFHFVSDGPFERRLFYFIRSQSFYLHECCYHKLYWVEASFYLLEVLRNVFSISRTEPLLFYKVYVKNGV